MNGASRNLVSSSACIYPAHLQAEADVAPLKEEDAYPANPQDAYGWEMLVAERRVRLGLLVGDPARPGRCALICG